jgi:hypothetical protein
VLLRNVRLAHDQEFLVFPAASATGVGADDGGDNERIEFDTRPASSGGSRLSLGTVKLFVPVHLESQPMGSCAPSGLLGFVRCSRTSL